MPFAIDRAKRNVWGMRRDAGKRTHVIRVQAFQNSAHAHFSILSSQNFNCAVYLKRIFNFQFSPFPSAKFSKTLQG